MKNVIDLLKISVEKYPEHIAFSDPKSSINFKDLLTNSKIIGTFLAKKCKKNSPVAFFTEKDVITVCGFLGTAFAGCCYSMLDIKQPEQRLHTVINILKPSVILTDTAHFSAAKKQNFDVDVYNLDDIIKLEFDENILDSIYKNSIDTDPLYINFTSGSTGIPKGVAVCHRSVIDFISSFTSIFGITHNDIIGNQAPFDFDVSVKDIYSGLMMGATVQIIPRGYFSFPTKLMDYLCEKNITTLIWAVSAMCFVSAMNGFEYKIPKTINKVLFSGEVMPPKHMKIWRKYLPDAQFVNLYGPTEITCNCTYYKIPKDFSDEKEIPIGIPFPNKRVFLLDDDNNLIDKPEISAELCVSGTALALGYYNNPEKTSQNFILNPLNTFYPEIIYKTGDIAKYDKNGLLFYLGRKDFQIKHMGHRIELGEIEAALNRCDGIARSCCIYWTEKKRILAFYEGTADSKNLVKSLRKILPQFMVPNAAIKTEHFYMTKNGKIDRKKLLNEYIENR